MENNTVLIPVPFFLCGLQFSIFPRFVKVVDRFCFKLALNVPYKPAFLKTKSLKSQVARLAKEIWWANLSPFILADHMSYLISSRYIKANWKQRFLKIKEKQYKIYDRLNVSGIWNNVT